jgi:hypothetical protein
MVSSLRYMLITLSSQLSSGNMPVFPRKYYISASYPYIQTFTAGAVYTIGFSPNIRDIHLRALGVVCLQAEELNFESFLMERCRLSPNDSLPSHSNQLRYGKLSLSSGVIRLGVIVLLSISSTSHCFTTSR